VCRLRALTLSPLARNDLRHIFRPGNRPQLLQDGWFRFPRFLTPIDTLEIALGMFIDCAWVAATRLWPISRLLPCVPRTYSLVVVAW